MKHHYRAVLAAIAEHGQTLVRVPDDVAIDMDDATLAACLSYLEGHGLIHCGQGGEMSSGGVRAAMG